MSPVKKLILGLTATWAASCSAAPHVVVVNATGAEMVLRVVNPGAAPQYKTSREVRIAPGKWKDLRPGDDFEHVRLKSRGCEVLYAMSEVFSTDRLTHEQQVDPNAPWAHYPVVVEVAPDLTIFYQRGNAKARVVPIEQLAAHQGYGFPVRPISKTCR